MYSLIATVIAILLAASLGLTTVYYGGEAFRQGQASAQAALLVNQGTQLMSAADLFLAKKGRWPDSLQEMLAENFLKEIPKPFAHNTFGIVSSAYADDLLEKNWTLPTPGQPTFFLRSGTSVSACKQLNLRTYGADGILLKARKTIITQCYGPSLTALHVVVTKSFSLDLALPFEDITDAAIPTDPLDPAWLLPPGSSAAIAAPPSAPSAPSAALACQRQNLIVDTAGRAPGYSDPGLSVFLAGADSATAFDGQPVMLGGVAGGTAVYSYGTPSSGSWYTIELPSNFSAPANPQTALVLTTNTGATVSCEISVVSTTAPFSEGAVSEISFSPPTGVLGGGYSVTGTALVGTFKAGPLGQGPTVSWFDARLPESRVTILDATHIRIQVPEGLSVGAANWEAIPGNPSKGYIGGAYVTNYGASSGANAYFMYLGSSSASPGSGSLTAVPRDPALGSAVVVGQSQGWEITLSNNSTAPVYVRGISVLAPSDFTQTENSCAGFITPGNDCTIYLTFAPSSIGPKAGTILVDTDSSAGPLEVLLAGRGIADNVGVLSIDSPALVFQAPGNTEELVVRNSGSFPLTLTSVTVANPDYFQLNNTCPSQLAAGGSCYVRVTLTAAGLAAPSALTITTGDGQVESASLAPPPLKAYLWTSTVGKGADITRLEFGVREVGTTLTLSYQINVRDDAERPVRISSLFFDSNASGGALGMTQTSDCLGLLSPGAFCTVRVTYTPAEGSNTSTLLRVASDADKLETEPGILDVTGTASTGGLLSVSDREVQVLNGSRAVVAVYNAGSLALSLNPATLSGGAPEHFALINNCPAQLAPKAGCTLLIQFNSVGTPEGTVLAITASNGQTVEVAVSGVLSGATVTSSGSRTLPATQVGQASTYAMTVTNFSADPFTVASVGFLDNTDFNQSNNCSAVLAMYESCTVVVQFSPSAAGSKNSTLVVVGRRGQESSDSLLAVPFNTFDAIGVIASGGLKIQSFPSTAVFTTSSGHATLTNTGIGPLSVKSITPSDTQYSVGASTCAVSIPAQTSCDYVISFSPTSEGPQPISLFAKTYQYSVRDPVGEVSRILVNSSETSPYGTPPADGSDSISLKPGVLNFHNQTAFYSSAPKSVILENVSTSVVTISGISVSLGASEFGQSNNCAGTLSPGARCTVLVSMTATQISANLEGAVSVVHDGIGSTTIIMNGSSISSGNQSADNRTMVFPSPVLVGSPGAFDFLELVNTTNAPVSVTGIMLDNKVDFSTVSNCANSLPAGSTCTITVAFNPQSEGAKAGNLTVQNGGSFMTVAISGQGIVGIAVPVPSAYSLDFSSQQVGTTSATKTFTLRNTGPVALNISQLEVSAGANQFGRSTTCGATLAPSAQCVVSVAFTPVSAAGYALGAVTIRHDGEGGSTTVMLTGRSQETVTAKETIYRNYVVDWRTPPDDVLLNITNPGASVMTITNLVIKNTRLTFTSGCPSALAAGQGCFFRGVLPAGESASGAKSIISFETDDYKYVYDIRLNNGPSSNTETTSQPSTDPNLTSISFIGGSTQSPVLDPNTQIPAVGIFLQQCGNLSGVAAKNCQAAEAASMLGQGVYCSWASSSQRTITTCNNISMSRLLQFLQSSDYPLWFPGGALNPPTVQ